MKIGENTWSKANFFNSYRLVVLLFFLIGSNYISIAQDRPGLSGFVQFSGSYFNFKTNTISGFMNNGISEPTTNSIYEKPNTQQHFTSLGASELRYTFPKRKYQLYFGGSMLDIVRLDLVQQFAIRRLLVNKGYISFGVLGATIPVAVWEDPYVEGIERVETDRNSVGLRFEWSNILNSNFTFQYDIRKVKIEEQSGDFLGLSFEEKNMLDRNGSVHRLKIGYFKKYGEHHLIIPGLVIGYSNAKGEAKRGYGISLEASHAYTKNRFTLATNLSGGIRKYRASNPIYNKKQTNLEFGFTESFFYRLNKNPKAILLLNASLAYLHSDSNIDFHTQSGFLVQLGIVLRFGPVLETKGKKESNLN